MKQRMRIAGIAGLAAFALIALQVNVSALAALPTQNDQIQVERSSILTGVFRGIQLGMTSQEVRKLIGKSDLKDDELELFKLSATRRIRVYYAADGRARAIVSTFFGDDSGAPAPEAVLGTSIRLAEDGSGSGTLESPDEGYSIVYSRVGGDNPMVLITMQRL